MTAVWGGGALTSPPGSSGKCPRGSRPPPCHGWWKWTSAAAGWCSSCSSSSSASSWCASSPSSSPALGRGQFTHRTRHRPGDHRADDGADDAAHAGILRRLLVVWQRCRGHRLVGLGECGHHGGGRDRRQLLQFALGQRRRHLAQRHHGLVARAVDVLENLVAVRHRLGIGQGLRLVERRGAGTILDQFQQLVVEIVVGPGLFMHRLGDGRAELRHGFPGVRLVDVETRRDMPEQLAALRLFQHRHHAHHTAPGSQALASPAFRAIL